MQAKFQQDFTLQWFSFLTFKWFSQKLYYALTPYDEASSKCSAKVGKV